MRTKRNNGLFWLALLAVFCALRIPAAAQQAGKIYRIGFLSGGFPGSSPNVEAFRHGLRELGYAEGKNIVIEYRYAEGKTDSRPDSRYPALVTDLVRLKVEVIAADGSGATRAAKKATGTIPIVMTTSTDPVAFPP